MNKENNTTFTLTSNEANSLSALLHTTPLIETYDRLAVIYGDDEALQMIRELNRIAHMINK